jgi:hypothetical protein
MLGLLTSRTTGSDTGQSGKYNNYQPRKGIIGLVLSHVIFDVDAHDLFINRLRHGYYVDNDVSHYV